MDTDLLSQTKLNLHHNIIIVTVGISKDPFTEVTTST